MCRARAAQRARRSTSSRRTNRHWGRAPPPWRRSAMPRASSNSIPMDRPRRCARPSRRATGSIPMHIVCGAGSDELLQLIAHAYLGPGDEAIYSAVSDSSSIRSPSSRMARPPWWHPNAITRPMSTPSSRASRRARASCSSPIRTIRPGRYLPFSEVKRLHAGLPRDVLLVLDAAYAEYVRRNDYEVGHRARRRPRTMS